MIYIHKDNQVPVEWRIKKGASDVLEDFSLSTLKVYLIGSNNRYFVPVVSSNNGVIKFTTLRDIPEDVYHVEAVWIKNERPLPFDKKNKFAFNCASPSIMKSRVDCLFGITNIQREATDLPQGSKIKVCSRVASYGYDGRDAWVTALFYGETANEKEWLEAYTGKLEAVQSATLSANQASSRANSSADLANAAKDGANQATTSANQAAASANQASTNANDKAKLANDAAAKAEGVANKFEANEEERTAKFNAGEVERKTEFDANEAARQKVFDDKEAERDAAVEEATKVASKVSDLEQEVKDIKEEGTGSGSEITENGFVFADSDGAIGFKYTEQGFDAAKISEHFMALIGGTSIIEQDNSRQEIMNLKNPSLSGGANYMTYFGVISDIHEDGENLQAFIDFCNFYGIDNKLHLGDSAKEYNYGKETSYRFWNNANGSNYVMNIVGNHDSRLPNGGWTGIPKSDVYNCIIKPFATSVEIAQPDGAESNGLCYYYKDLNDYIRLICLDCMFWNQDEADWLSNVLDDAKTNGKHVMIAVHYPTNDINLADSSFNTRVPNANITDTSINSKPSYLDNLAPTNASDLVQSFIDGGGIFIAWICGHQHRNWLGWLKRHTSQLQICVPSSRWDFSTPTYACEKGTINQHCFSIIGIDAYSKTLKLLRIGKRNDSFMQFQKQFSYNYLDNTLIYTD